MNSWLRHWQERLGLSYYLLVGCICSALIFVFGFSSIQPVRHEFELNQLSDVTVRAPRTIEDEEETQAQEQLAATDVEDIYSFQPAIGQQRVQLLQEFFNLLIDLRKQSYHFEELQASSDAEAPAALARYDGAMAYHELPDDWQQYLYERQLANQSPELQEYAQMLTVDLLRDLQQESTKSLKHLQLVLSDQLAEVLAEDIDYHSVENAKHKLKQQLWSLSSDYLTSDEIYRLVDPLVVATLRYDEEQTEQARTEAIAQVQPSYILQGQVIAQEGHVIDQKTYHQLELFGFIDQTTHVNKTYLFVFLIVIHLLVTIYLRDSFFEAPNLEATSRPTSIAMRFTAYYSLLTITLAFVALGFYLESQSIHHATLLLPVGLMTLLARDQLGAWPTIKLNLIFCLLALFYLNTPDSSTQSILSILFYLMSSSMFMLESPIRLPRHPIRSNLVFQWCLHLLIILPTFSALNFELFTSLGLEFALLLSLNVVLVYSLYFFIEPYWLQIFNDRAPLTLHSLSNLNHPLLKQLIDQAPGTYHHSLMVANLAANAVEAIDGDSLLTRVAGYYHDVGKMSHPLFFIENLPRGMESPHQMLTPKESAQVIIEHVTQGVQILSDHQLPQSVIDLCQQHHGSTLVAYFYHQAKEQSTTVDMDDYRYPGPAPQSKEAIVLMLADSLEAASRTLASYEPVAIEQLVDNIIDQKIAEDQFDQSQLTVAELEIVRRSLTNGIASMYHTRIQYPTERG